MFRIRAGGFRRAATSPRAAALLLGMVALVAAGVASAAARDVTITFNRATLPFPDGTILRHQLADHYRIEFSAEDSDLPPAYRLSLGPQENVVRSAGMETELINPFRIFFLDHSVKSVSVSMEDRNLNDQRHTLTAFSSSGTVLDAASVQDHVAGDTAGSFTMTVTSSRPIAYVVVLEQPFGAEVLRELRYRSEGPD
jgi:hypothetical protein